MSKSIGNSISTNVTKQLQRRQDIFEKKFKDDKDLKFLSSKSAWILLRSSVDRVNESDAAACVTDPSARIKAGKDGANLAKRYKLSNAPNRAGISGDNALYSSSDFYGYRPKPGITDLSVQSKNTFGTLLEAVVKFKVFSVDDFNNIEKLYFRPGYTALLEWGNTVYVDNDGYVQYASQKNAIPDSEFFTMQSFNKMDRKVQAKRNSFDGNYDGMFGYIVNFDWNVNNDGTYDCSVKLLSRGTVLEGLKGSKIIDFVPSGEIKENEKEDDKESETKSLFHYIISRGIDDLSNYGGGKVASMKDTLINNKAKTVGSALISDFKVYMMHQEDAEGAEIDIFYIPLRGLLIIYNSFIALTNPGTDQTDATFVYKKSEINNKHSIPSKAFSIDPSVAVLPYPPRNNEDFKECKLRPDKLLGLHDTMASDTGGTSKDVLDLMICSTTIEAVAEQFMVGDINENKGMMDFMQGILSKTNEAFGGVCELDIAYHHEAPYACQFTVVDRKGEKSKAPATIDIFGLSSTIFDINISSKISSNIANQVAMAAQSTKPETSQDDIDVLLTWNRGCIDRHMPVKEQGEAKPPNDDTKDKREKFIEGMEKVYDNFNNVGNKNYDPSFLSKHRADATAELVSYKARSTKSDPTLGIVPVELSIDLDGVQGFVIGSSFQINKGILPEAYAKFGYIITAVSHTIGTDMKWKTSVGTQFYPIKNITG